MNSTQEPTKDSYQRRIDAIMAQVANIQSGEFWLSRWRGLTFLMFLVPAVLGWTEIGPRSVCYPVAALAFIGFVGVVGLHEQRQRQRKKLQLRGELQRQQLARFCRQWDRVPVPKMDVPVEHGPVAVDLDLMGKGSLYHWLCRAHTPGGLEMLRDWIVQPAAPDEIAARQAAVEWLAAQRTMRDNFELHGRMLAQSDTGPAGLTEWAESDPWYRKKNVLKWILRALTALMITIPILIVARVVPPSWIFIVFAQVVIHVLLNAIFVGRVHDLFNSITAGKNELVHYSSLFESVDALPEDVVKLRSLRSRLHVDGTDFRRALHGLQRVMKLGNGRRSSLYGVPYVLVQILIFWDFHVLEWLEKWQVEHGHSVRGWFQSVSELEALSSLAAVASDHPHWAFPTVECGAERLIADQLGHPLLPVDKCVRNDIELGPSGTFLLVTGSNMSGKSTLLRAIGVNSVMAQAGGPVCATKMALPAVELATSMRVTDSLNDGVSFFFAELRRLKDIVDQSHRVAADSVAAGTKRRLLFLLDEILQGTNSAERHIAVARVIGFLVGQPTLGAVSTHDLELANAPELSDCCQTVHFREQFEFVDGKKQMSFDYRLREGVSPTTNALKLLEMVGLGD